METEEIGEICLSMPSRHGSLCEENVDSVKNERDTSFIRASLDFDLLYE